ncbi:hypothetical protein QMT25_17985 [Cronobacter dublinensis]|uniref:hypothetical protein n=1 Tax=Cronobacter dublinensis TaxID=413497 RepID=UPI001375BB58|nr:hypothetical protein [Cronobacter dublinensis]EKY3088124.1 hypothetical protein [Cronobacter dublinensis]ELQ6229917.1 hypothetical protein [Cronobacter dublinensis]ELY4004801.1 hypothetical protein [Cronobacter dublinensis]ELY4410011.1 hypothetical protein [Cronobacter dublinensis]ELY5818121.1 hypothetical protein [Cronobacter dublinensis]
MRRQAFAWRAQGLLLEIISETDRPDTQLPMQHDERLFTAAFRAILGVTPREFLL